MLEKKTKLAVLILGFFLFSALFLAILSPHIAFAQAFQLLQPLSPDFNRGAQTGDIPTVVNAVLGMILGLATALAVVMIVIGGFIYATAADSESRKSEGKEKIQDAVLGLLLLFGSYLLLYTINPQLVSLNLAVQQTGGGGQTQTDGGTETQGTQTQTSLTPVDQIVKVGPDGQFLPTYSDTKIQSHLAGTYQHMDLLTRVAGEEGASQHVSVLQGIMAIENAGKSGPGSGSGAGALGLMQVTYTKALEHMRPEDYSAHGIEPGNPNALIAALQNDNELNLKMAIRTYQDALTYSKGNIPNALAEYNGGRAGALGPSADCDGLLKWQCTIKPGGLVQTQAYVPNVIRASQLITPVP